MRIIGIKCENCGRKGELWPDDVYYPEARVFANYSYIFRENGREFLKCDNCGGYVIKHDLKSNGQCWSFGEMSKAADGGGDNGA